MPVFETYPTPVLRAVEENLLRGLDRVAESLDAGTFFLVGPGGKAAPCESGNITLGLLNAVRAELARR